jgi:hypothetical protein
LNQIEKLTLLSPWKFRAENKVFLYCEYDLSKKIFEEDTFSELFSTRFALEGIQYVKVLIRSTNNVKIFLNVQVWVKKNR